jgi:hypothetical protein
MNDTVVEKLVQKVINLTEEVNDVNIVVRGITPPQAIVNKIHERIDALLAGIQQIEKQLGLDERRLKELEDQTKLLKEEMEFRKRAIHDVGEKIIKNNEELGESFRTRLATMDKHAQGRFEEMEITLQSAFETQKWWLVVLSVVLAIFGIILWNR